MCSISQHNLDQLVDATDTCWRSKLFDYTTLPRDRNLPGTYLAAADLADKRVYCHEALRMQKKLQKAGYKQVAAKWDLKI